MRPQLRTRSALGLILLAGAALRLYRLGADSLWYDETVSTYLAGSRLPELLRHTAGDIHPPGFYILLRGWLVLMGYPTGHADAHGIGLEFSAAFFSLFFGVLLIALVYALARRVANRPGRTHRRAAGSAQPVQHLVQPGSADVHAGCGAGGRGGVRAGAYRAGDRGQGAGVRCQGPGTRDQEPGGGLVGYLRCRGRGGDVYALLFHLPADPTQFVGAVADSIWWMANTRDPDASHYSFQLPASCFQLPASCLAPRQSRRSVAIRSVDSNRFPPGDEPARPALAHRA